MSILVILIAILVLELLPYGAVLNFMADGRDVLIRKTYSYFSMMPFGYANFGPLLTAISTTLLILLSVGFVIKDHFTIKKALKVVTIIALIFSVSPLLFGLHFYSVIGLIISLLFLIIIIILFIYEKSYKPLGEENQVE